MVEGVCKFCHAPATLDPQGPMPGFDRLQRGEQVLAHKHPTCAAAERLFLLGRFVLVPTSEG